MFLIISCSFIIGCGLISYENQTHYELAIDETVEIYYSTNSCCYYCFAEEQNLRHIEYIEKKTLDSGPTDCDGCNSTSAYIFKAISAGIDTIRLKHTVASVSCEDADVAPEEYIVKVD